jgi:hypothetical protein
MQRPAKSTTEAYRGGPSAGARQVQVEGERKITEPANPQQNGRGIREKENNGSSIRGRTRSWKESRDGQSTLKSRRGNACDLSNNRNSMAGSDALLCVENKNL